MDTVGKYILHVMKFAGWYNNWLFSLIEPHLSGDILEVGAGIGNFTPFLAKKGEVVAIDINEDYLADLKKLVGKKVKVGLGDVEKGKYFFKKKIFDSVVCLNVLEHIGADKKAIRNMYELLKPGGKLILLVPAHRALFGILDENLGHKRRYTKNQLVKKVALAGFVFKDARYLNLLGSLGWYVNSKVLKRKILPLRQLKVFDKLSRPLLSLEKKMEPPFGLSVLAIAIKPVVH